MEVFSFSNIIAALSLLVAAYSVGYSVRTNTKIYELTVNYKNEVIDWYSLVIDEMILLIHMVRTDDFDSSSKIRSLATLSSLIERGRFFYPNVHIGDNYGADKPIAYRGYRSIPLEFLVYFYEIAKKNNAGEYEKHLFFLERHFTSYIFENLDPISHNKQRSKIMKVKYDDTKNLDDFLEAEPDMLNIFEIVQ